MPAPRAKTIAISIRRRCTVVAALAAVLLLAGSVQSVARPAFSMVVVGKDARLDWGDNIANGGSLVGEYLDQDLLEARIGMATSKSVSFELRLKRMNGFSGIGIEVFGTPEITRYKWAFAVDRNFYELDGKATNYSRATCNPEGPCPPPRDPGLGPFTLSSCNRDGTTCQEVGLVNATYRIYNLITIELPVRMIRARPGSVISGRSTEFGDAVVAFPDGADLAPGSFPHDTMKIKRTFTIPK